MIAANEEIFQSLDTYCAGRGDPVVNAGEDRWIATTNADRKVLKQAKLKAALSFTRRRSIARLDFFNTSYFCVVGFDHAIATSGLLEEELNAGLLTAVLSELRVLPSASTAEIRNIVEVANKADGVDYKGHEPTLIASIYPSIRVFSAKNAAESETWRIIFLVCLSECRNAETWIDQNFANTLQGLAELEILNVPYKTLCRSIFDSDPAAMFLALYRCMEALYAFSSAKRLIGELGLNHTWAEVATALENTLGWHPKEESSLGELMAYGAAQDQSAVFSALGENIPATSDGPLFAAAGRRLYRLRNDLVHFRPSQHQIDHTVVEWNRLCEAAAALVCYIYAEVFTS